MQNTISLFIFPSVNEKRLNNELKSQKTIQLLCTSYFDSPAIETHFS